MTFKKLALGFVALIFLPGLAFAQSTATPVVTGYLTTSGCAYGQTTCFVQFGSGGGGGGGAVTNAGTFAVQNTTATPAGTNIIGKVGIDQTTPGTTNGVSEVASAIAQFTPGVTAGVGTLTVAGTKNLYTAYLTNTDTVVHYLWIVNTTTAPVNGTFTAGIVSGNVQDCIAVAAGTSGSIGGLSIPENFSAQPYLANSTTGCGATSNTLTLSTIGFMHVLAK